MKITRLSTAVLEANFDWTIVKIETDEGITGYGEACIAPGLTAAIREFAGILIGEDPTSIDRIVRRMRMTTIYASPGVVWHAIGGIEAALLDIIGRRHGLPVWQILGGKYRDEVRIYADCHAGEALDSIDTMLVPRKPAWMEGHRERGAVSLKHHGWDASKPEHLTANSYAMQAQRVAALGFTILKFDVDVPMPYETDEYNRHLSHREVEYAASLIFAVRSALGPEIELAVDCHWNYDVDSAVELARALEPYKLMWLEDPVPPGNIRAIGEVQRSTITPVATGENHYSRLDFQELITAGGLRVLAPDVQKLGVWEGRKVADLADLHYVGIAWHNVSGPLGTMAGVHLAAATPNFLALEWHGESVPFFDELVKDAAGPMILRGKIGVPSRPGLGIDFDEQAAYKYRKPGERFFE